MEIYDNGSQIQSHEIMWKAYTTQYIFSKFLKFTIAQKSPKTLQLCLWDMTFFIYITMLCRTDNSPQNILHNS